MSKCAKVVRKKKAVIIQPGAIGDGILTLPLARLLQEEGTFEEVDLLAHRDTLGFLEGRSEISQVLSLESIPLHRLFIDSNQFAPNPSDELLDVFLDYDLIVTFLYDDEGHFEKNLVYLTVISHAPDVATLKLRPPEDYTGHASEFFMEQFVQELPYSLIKARNDIRRRQLIKPRQADKQAGELLLRNAGLKSKKDCALVAIHPGSGGREKCWPVESYLQLIQQLTSSGVAPVILIGPAEDERWTPDVLDMLHSHCKVLSGLTLVEVTMILSCCQGYVGNDSGITHLAGAMGLPTVAIFGPTNPTQWQPMGTHSHVCNNYTSGWPSVLDVSEKLQQFL